jgi:hypothetical protein
LDKRQSWRGSALMSYPNGDKIVIKRNAADGHHIYCSVRDDADKEPVPKRRQCYKLAPN